MNDKKPTHLTVKSGLGKELCDLLRAALAVPEGVTAFSVHFTLDAPVRVECDYMPRVADQPLPRRIESQP